MTEEKKKQRFIVQQWGYVPELIVAKLHDDAILPQRKHKIDAGVDFFAYGDYIIAPQTSKKVHTGITVDIPVGYFMLLKPKGGSDWLVGAGVADAEYQGEFVFKIFNPYARQIIIRNGDAIGQAVLVPISTPDVKEIPLDKIHQDVSIRGESGGIHKEN